MRGKNLSDSFDLRLSWYGRLATGLIFDPQSWAQSEGTISIPSARAQAIWDDRAIKLTQVILLHKAGHFAAYKHRPNKVNRTVKERALGARAARAEQALGVLASDS